MSNEATRIKIIDEDIERSNFRLIAMRAEYQRLGQDIIAEVNALKKLQERRADLVPLTVEQALQSHVDHGENGLGLKILRDMAVFKGTGLSVSGSYWNQTNQWQLRVQLNYRSDRATIEKLARAIEEMAPMVKAGALEDTYGPLKTMSKGASVKVSELKAFDIFEHTLSMNSNWLLAQKPDGEWLIFDQRYYRWGRARIVGTLLECLEEISNGLWYDGGPRCEEDDD